MDVKKDKPVNIHVNHRQKVKNMYFESGLNGMADHNVIELLLFFGIQRKDTNPMAHELMERFGSFSGVLEAKKSDLMLVKGMTENAACLITMILPLYKRYMKDVTSKSKLDIEDKKGIIKFLRGLFIDNGNTEQVYALCFSNNGKFLSCRKISQGDIASSSLNLRNLASFVLEVNASSVILAHNHPHGIALPSPADVNATKSVYAFLKSLKVRLADHIIITDDKEFLMAKSHNFVHIFYE